MKKLFSLFTLIFAFNFTSFAQEQSLSTDARNTYKDIKQTLGMVPTFLKEYPQGGITGAWEDMKEFRKIFPCHAPSFPNEGSQG